MTTDIKEYRYKRVMISANKILSLFQQPTDEYVNVFNLHGIPKDVKVVRVYFDHSYGMFSFVIEHESFPPVKDYDIIPVHNELFTIVMERCPEYHKCSEKDTTG